MMVVMRDEGIIKFICEWQKTELAVDGELRSLVDCRNRLFGRGWIGVYPDGVGFGNVSLRYGGGPTFLISGSQTGDIALADDGHFCEVTGWDIEANRIVCRGPVKASSESMTHAMIYDTFPDCLAVIHIHHAEAWQRLKGKLPTSDAGVPYGTPAMAAEVRRLESGLRANPVLVMAGHEDGLLAFAASLEKAESALLSVL